MTSCLKMFVFHVIWLLVPTMLALSHFHLTQALTQPGVSHSPGLGEAPIDLEALKRLQADMERGVDVEQLFSKFKLVLHKHYTDVQEENRRKQIFAARVRRIRAHNQLYEKGDKPYSLALNKFSDMSHEEFVNMYTVERLMKKSKNDTNFRTASASSIHTDLEELTFRGKRRHADADSVAHSGGDIPAYVNWKDRGYVTSVKDQGDCGSCWAFAVLGSLEGLLYRKTNRTVSLSVQQLVDCDNVSRGCDGGFPIWALKYIMAAGGVMTEEDYPYMAKDGTSCLHDRSKSVPGSQVSSHVVLAAEDELELRNAVARVGPVITGMDINPEDFMDYGQGVFYDASCEKAIHLLDHAVVVVGYGSEPEEYWLIKNSMGPSWGEDGYMRLARNRGNNCGVATRALYPVAPGDGVSSLSAAVRIIASCVFISATALWI